MSLAARAASQLLPIAGPTTTAAAVGHRRAAARPHQRDDQPCLVHLHVISLVALTASRQVHLAGRADHHRLDSAALRRPVPGLARTVRARLVSITVTAACRVCVLCVCCVCAVCVLCVCCAPFCRVCTRAVRGQCCLLRRAACCVCVSPRAEARRRLLARPPAASSPTRTCWVVHAANVDYPQA